MPLELDLGHTHVERLRLELLLGLFIGQSQVPRISFEILTCNSLMYLTVAASTVPSLRA